MTSGPQTVPARLDFDLPGGWWCLDLVAGTDMPDQIRSLGLAADVERGALGTAAWLRDQGAGIALLRPGSPDGPSAICGGVFIAEATAGTELYETLDAAGEAVALGDLHGIPIISHISWSPGDDQTSRSTMHVSYLICPPSMCIVITFVALDCDDRKHILAELAKIVSAVRVVHSDAGCPV